MSRLLALLLALTAHAAFAAAPVAVTITSANGPQVFALEAATTGGARTHGLMERRALPKDGGMLFVFPEQARRAFWMKNTPLPLDMLFVAADGRIVHIAPNTAPLSETPIDSHEPCNAVVELLAGTAQARGIREGDRVTYTLPEGTHVD